MNSNKLFGTCDSMLRAEMAAYAAKGGERLTQAKAEIAQMKILSGDAAHQIVKAKQLIEKLKGVNNEAVLAEAVKEADSAIEDAKRCLADFHRCEWCADMILQDQTAAHADMVERAKVVKAAKAVLADLHEHAREEERREVREAVENGALCPAPWEPWSNATPSQRESARARGVKVTV